ncbi:lipid A deacylase LpxR family protein [Pelagicoccus sp. SDUM812002]|uniref:lipid A deacylase LpxR family protein n=1 Tax=Pelagicoccus sp. SDUM812002 TaxID=3041266 RepID=UPI00281064E4|nr:lipid A deacylase LpxR family protein [Pelagicoccus sp. SDUM812002]MDQ8184576.1 lipid A deacylase LpxR family protein [Pelagicoccus sp. SDUM812002]
MKTAYLLLALWLVSLARIPLDASQGKLVSVQLQNDAVAGTDENYSSGLEVVISKWIRSYSSYATEYSGDEVYNPPTPGVLGFNSQHISIFNSVAVGQKIYTPSDLSETRYIPNDRPYAGWSYIRLSHERASTERRNRVAITAGTFGPNSLAGELQRSFHKLISSQEPRGWDHQIENEIAIDLTLERESRIYTRRVARDYRFTLSSSQQATLGTANTNLKLGLVASLGKGTSRSKQASTRYFSRVTASHVGRDRTLNGPLPAGYDSVRKSSIVSEFEFGLERTMKFGRLAVSVTRRSRQFEGQASSQTFGTIRYTFW